ncbi:MAG TPA: class I SAM-dependent methyltransferase [Candidatus Krumholzibacterium sp.]|nr:class I SAM-dependent methyltransferase [Candidatus Krumholzibacterium sp.]
MKDNPWLKIPASDYEGHMESPEVRQAQMLSRIFTEALEKHDSSTIALLGCATGNGLDSIRKGRTARVTAVDINPGYLAVLRERYEGVVEGLETIEADLEECVLDKSAYSLVFAGLIFEYLDPEGLLRRIAEWLSPAGILVSVLQMSATGTDKVTATGFESLRLLAPVMKLVRPCQFRAMACGAGLSEVDVSTVTLDSGKSFFIGVYRK